MAALCPPFGEVAPSTVIPAEFIFHRGKVLYTRALWIPRRWPAPHYVPQKKTDFPSSSWPYRDGWANRIAATGLLREATIPVSPQAARPAVSERETGTGRVPGCSAMPGAWKSQPAPGKAHGRREQDTVERHGGLDVVMEKIVQREQENPISYWPRNDRRFPPPGVKDVAS